MGKNKPLRFCFIDDDKHNWEQWRVWAKQKNYKVSIVDNALSANKISADFYVFDISVVAPFNLNLHSAYSPITSIASNHPHSTIVIIAGVSKSDAESVCDDVEQACGVRPVYGGWGTYEHLEKALEPFL